MDTPTIYAAASVPMVAAQIDWLQNNINTIATGDNTIFIDTEVLSDPSLSFDSFPGGPGAIQEIIAFGSANNTQEFQFYC